MRSYSTDDGSYGASTSEILILQLLPVVVVCVIGLLGDGAWFARATIQRYRYVIDRRIRKQCCHLV